MSQFFVSPLLNEKAIERESKAVESEFQISKSVSMYLHRPDTFSDGRRISGDKKYGYPDIHGG